MKKGFKIFVCSLVISLLICVACVCISAAGDSNSNGSISVISYGLRVLAAQTDMRVAGVKGQTFNFSQESFLRGMNLSDIDSIQITALPEATSGTLYCGSEPMTAGQTVSGEDISKITFCEARGFGNYAGFKFRVNGSAYETECKIYLISYANSAPSTSNASYASLNMETHKNISASGVLCGYDKDGDELTFEIVRYPEEGSIKVLDKNYGTYTYMPSENYSGKDSFEYVIRDKYGNYSASTTVSVTVSVPSVAVTYSDLVDTDIHTYAISLTEDGIMNGVQVGDYFYFRPDTEVSRAEFVVTAMTALGIKSVPDVTDTGFFDDEDIRPEMKGYIALAYSKGYISGIKKDGEIYFNPDETIKLSEASVILSNIIGYSEPEIKPVFSDASSIPAWSERAVVSLHTLGVIQSGDGSIEAGKDITRGVMAELLCRTMLITGN